MISRRQVLAFLATIPFLKFLLPKDAEASEPLALPPPSSSGPYRDAARESLQRQEVWTTEALTEQLWQNLVDYRENASNAERLWAPEEKQLHRKITEAFCKHLSDWSLSEPFVVAGAPPFDGSLTSFAAFKGGPVDLFHTDTDHPYYGTLHVLTAMTRKVKAVFNLEAVQDLVAYHGPKAVDDYIDAIGQQAALEVQMEIRADARNGSQPNLYAIYLPPWLSASTLDPKDFSICRRARIRYAKARKRTWG